MRETTSRPKIVGVKFNLPVVLAGRQSDFGLTKADGMPWTMTWRSDDTIIVRHAEVDQYAIVPLTLCVVYCSDVLA